MASLLQMSLGWNPASNSEAEGKGKVFTGGARGEAPLNRGWDGCLAFGGGSGLRSFGSG